MHHIHRCLMASSSPEPYDADTDWDDKMEASPKDEVEDSPWYETGEEQYYGNYNWWSDLVYMQDWDGELDDADREEWKDEPNEYEGYVGNYGDGGHEDGDDAEDEDEDELMRLEERIGGVLFEEWSQHEEE
ncbi:hypothetical protein H2200_005256 [Cladophialophora chaetospira]|uniref:Uncharacterized protein n=1 Tax=Cladophialophora chaetospira TaxID=386627 RepID=A0AA38XBQ9_9EURO|nr:hypothetical protein H2200_005256 [Cladophialophora chaetospira]